MTSEFFSNNRKKLLDKLDEGSIVLLYSGSAPVKSNDQDMWPFSVNRNFYYLTGIDTQNVWLMMTKVARGAWETLFIDEPDEYNIKWNGKMLTKEEAAQRSGIEEGRIHYMQEMDRIVFSHLSDGVDKACFALERRSMNAPHPSRGIRPDAPGQVPDAANHERYQPHRFPADHQDPGGDRLHPPRRGCDD